MTRCSVISPETPPAATGSLRLGISTREGRSYAGDQYHQGALRILRPHYLDASGQVGYTIVNPGGAYLGSDRYEIDISVHDGASLLLTTQSATKVYRTPQGPAAQRMAVTLGRGATLELVPDQLIVYREGSYRQRTDIVMHPTASLVLAEVVTPGWSPTGAAFAYQDLRLRTQVSARGDDGREALVLIDQLRLVPDAGTTGLGVMEGRTHVGQLLVVDARVDEALADEVHALVGAAAVTGAVSRAGLPAAGDHPLSGLVVRALADGTEPLSQLHVSIIDLLRARWRGQSALRLRKY